MATAVCLRVGFTVRGFHLSTRGRGWCVNIVHTHQDWFTAIFWTLQETTLLYLPRGRCGWSSYAPVGTQSAPAASYHCACWRSKDHPLCLHVEWIGIWLRLTDRAVDCTACLETCYLTIHNTYRKTQAAGIAITWGDFSFSFRCVRRNTFTGQNQIWHGEGLRCHSSSQFVVWSVQDGTVYQNLKYRISTIFSSHRAISFAISTDFSGS